MNTRDFVEDQIDGLRADNASMALTIDGLADQVRRLNGLLDQAQEDRAELSELLGNAREDNMILADRNAVLADRLARIDSLNYNIATIIEEQS